MYECIILILIVETVFGSDVEVADRTRFELLPSGIEWSFGVRGPGSIDKTEQTTNHDQRFCGNLLFLFSKISAF